MRHPAPSESGLFKTELGEYFIHGEPIIGWIRIADDCAVPVIACFRDEPVRDSTGNIVPLSEIMESVNPNPDAVWS